MNRLLIAIPALLLSACATNDRLLNAQRAMRAGQFSSAASMLAGTAAKAAPDSKDAVILKLEAGSAASLGADPAQALELLKSADHAIEAANQRAVVQLGREAGAVLSNLNTLPYTPSPADQIMGAAYLALSFAQQGSLEQARSAVKLAKNRQADAFARDEREIERNRSAMNQAREQARVPFNLDESKLNQVSSTIEADLLQYAPYAEHSVPYAELIAGLLLGCGENAEPDRARESFTRALAASPGNSALAQAAYGNLSGRLHLIQESGVAPSLIENAVHLPLFINGNLVMFSAAYPRMEFHPLAGNSSISVSGSSPSTFMVCDFDRIAAGQFRRRLPGIIARTTAASVTKAVASYVAQQAIKQQNSDYAVLAGLVGAAYNVASAKADLRIWAGLPKQVSYANLAMPADGKLTIDGRSYELPKGKTVIVRVRQVAGHHAVQMIAL